MAASTIAVPVAPDVIEFEASRAGAAPTAPCESDDEEDEVEDFTEPGPSVTCAETDCATGSFTLRMGVCLRHAATDGVVSTHAGI